MCLVCLWVLLSKVSMEVIVKSGSIISSPKNIQNKRNASQDAILKTASSVFGTKPTISNTFIMPLCSGLCIGLFGVFFTNQNSKNLSPSYAHISYDNFSDRVKIGHLEAVTQPQISQAVPKIISKEVEDAQTVPEVVPASYNIRTSVLKNSEAHLSARDEILIGQVFKIIRKFTRNQQEGLKLAGRIVAESKRNKYDPLFVAAVVKSESGFNTLATSNVGARGLMQIMPETGKYLEKIQDFGPRPAGFLTDPQYNLKLGINYLKYLEKMFDGNKVLTLIAYNWGPGKVNQTVSGKTRGVPQEVMNYALKILHDHNNWKKDIVVQG